MLPIELQNFILCNLCPGVDKNQETVWPKIMRSVFENEFDAGDG